MNRYAVIAGTGSYLPDKILLNKDLPENLETSDEWIFQRVGIKQRHIAAADDTVASMGAKAAARAMDAAQCTAADIDMIVVASCSAETVFPATACLIQAALNIPPCAAFDLQAACTGFIYALNLANACIQNGTVRRALVIGSEAMSRVVDWQDRGTCVLFGDGAGAVVLEASEKPGIWSTILKASGQHANLLSLKNCATPTLEQHHKALPYIQMQGNLVFRFAVKVLEESARALLNRHLLTAADIHWLVPHQANIRIMQATADKLGLNAEQLVVTVDQHGNTSAASIPLALDTAVRAGKIQRGQNLLLEAVGGGMTWGAALITY